MTPAMCERAVTPALIASWIMWPLSDSGVALFDADPVRREEVAGERLDRVLGLVLIDHRLRLAELGLPELLLAVQHVEVRGLAEVEAVALDLDVLGGELDRALRERDAAPRQLGLRD